MSAEADLGQPAASPVGGAAHRRTPVAAGLAAVAGILFWTLLVAGWLGGLSYRPAAAVPFSRGAGGAPGEIARLERHLAEAAPHGVYITIDTVGNRLDLRRGDRILRSAVCSTGSGAVLVDAPSGRRWVFDTPRGVHRVREKRRDPIWTKPDWAFIEEGEPVPRDWRERRDPIALGDYALDFGNGYLIHGTLYQRLLGRSVTHGCIRLGDDDLAAVYRAAPVGTRIYIF